MRYIKFKTFNEANSLNNRVTAECLSKSEWNSGTDNYCTPSQDDRGQWLVPVIEGYEKYFTTGELDRAWNDDDIVPREVPLWCLRAALRILNMLTQVEAAVNAMPEGTPQEQQLKIAAQEGLTYANTVLRNSQTTLFVQSVLGLSDTRVDDIFIMANQINA